MRLSLLSFFICLSILHYAQPKEEVRAVWLTTVFNLDWPKATGANNQKNEMIKLLDSLKATNFNTIMFQVRGRGDLLYPSSIEPWAVCLTGSLGSNPGYDPLAFTISEAHKRGIEVHAWWNVVKVYGTGVPPSTSPQHIVNRRPDLVKLYANEWWLDMGYPDSRTYLLNLAVEMIRNYDLDGIHFDFLRYPNPDFNDDASYTLYGNGANRSDWRRANLNQFVYALYDSVQAIRPDMKVGSAPIGIFRDLSSCVSGWDAYTQVFQDSRRWMLARKHDYLAPQLYWAISTCPRFDSLAIDWIRNTNNRHVYTGIAAYRMGSSDGNWPASEILAQVDSSRKFGAEGQTFYRTQSIKDNQKSITSLLRSNQYLYPANIPSMPWKDSTKPNPPSSLEISTVDSLNFLFRWSKPLPASDGDTAYYYNLYMDDQYPVDISDIKNVVKFKIINDTSTVVKFNSKPQKNYYFTVTAYDRGNNESTPSGIVSIIVTDVEDKFIADGFSLEQNYPNPFNPTTTIRYSIPLRMFITLEVYNMLGQKVQILVQGEQDAGNYEVTFDAEQLESGVYFYTISAGKYRISRKLLVLR